MLQWPCEISYGCVLCNIRFERLQLALSLFFLYADTSEKLWHSSIVELILTNTERNIDIKTYYKVSIKYIHYIYSQVEIKTIVSKMITSLN